MPTEGVDYSRDRPLPEQLVRAGKRFAVRYGGPGSIDKQLWRQEAIDLTRAGVSIVANAEGVANGLLGGGPVGSDWARRAHGYFTDRGMPATRPIYFSVDFDVQDGQWPAVRDALHGAADELGRSRVGIYGSLDAVRWARRDRCAAWFWQTYAWSHGDWASGNHIEQYRNGVRLGDGTVDLDRAFPADYGQWTVPGIPGPGNGGDMLSEQDLVAIGDQVIASLDRDVAWRSPGVRTYFEGQGWRPVSTRDAIEYILERADKVETRPGVDPAAIADALAGNPAFVEALATAVAAKLIGTGETLTLTGTMTGTIAPTPE